jgi:hypothetical protein
LRVFFTSGAQVVECFKRKEQRGVGTDLCGLSSDSLPKLTP